MKYSWFIFAIIMSGSLIGMNEFYSQPIEVPPIEVPQIIECTTASGIKYLYLKWKGQAYPNVDFNNFYPDFPDAGQFSIPNGVLYKWDDSQELAVQYVVPDLYLPTKVCWRGLVHAVRPLLNIGGKMLDNNDKPNDFFLKLVKKKQNELCGAPNRATILAMIGTLLVNDFGNKSPQYNRGIVFLKRAINSGQLTNSAKDDYQAILQQKKLAKV